MTGNAYFDAITELKWCEGAGIGFLPLKETPYDYPFPNISLHSLPFVLQKTGTCQACRP